MVILIGLSRIYLGVHSIGQVLLGWVYGLMQLGLFKLAQKPLSRYQPLPLDILMNNSKQKNARKGFKKQLRFP